MSSVVVLITGAAGRIAYSLIPLVCNGVIFGKNVRIHLRLLDIEAAASTLNGVKMEIEDCNFELLDSIVSGFDHEASFVGVQVAILLGGYPRLAGMERRDLIAKNAEGMREQAQALDKFADKNVKVLVVANPANTNCLVAMKFAPSIPYHNFTCLTRLDHERLKGFVAEKLSEDGTPVKISQVHDVAIFGNHSATQVPYLGRCKISTYDKNGEHRQLVEHWPDHSTDSPDMVNMIKKLQGRGAAIIQAQKASSAVSAASAIAKHLISWLGLQHGHTHECSASPPRPPVPGQDRQMFSMGVLSDGNEYNIPPGLVFSFPCQRASHGHGHSHDDDYTGAASTSSDNTSFSLRKPSWDTNDVHPSYEIVPGLILDSFTQSLLQLTVDELLAERADAESIVGSLQLVDGL